MVAQVPAEPMFGQPGESHSLCHHRGHREQEERVGRRIYGMGGDEMASQGSETDAVHRQVKLGGVLVVVVEAMQPCKVIGRKGGRRRSS